MSRKSNLKQFQLITNGDMSTASLTSPVTNIEFMDNIGVQLEWSGSPVGNFQVQVSIDYNQDYQGNVLNAGNWVPLQLNGSQNVPTSVGSPILLDLNQLSPPWIRVVYTRTSGSGTLQAWIAGKMV